LVERRSISGAVKKSEPREPEDPQESTLRLTGAMSAAAVGDDRLETV